ncbi:hypothetical protein HYDPIDRAFT_111076 [Hydnomerulius pinastri MD-312]|uniref:Uncharacterized protein n=1 Tax=Hydnomerulius pinastri MD-312 TaxID=994086 RepID=A0A0C9WAZ7_9AGAM|nr:hypothetical protein HYDPIDRAFT_111076 [Hydnomerulius pinastri MD-312]
MVLLSILKTSPLTLYCAGSTAALSQGIREPEPRDNVSVDETVKFSEGVVKELRRRGQ